MNMDNCLEEYIEDVYRHLKNLEADYVSVDNWTGDDIPLKKNRAKSINYMIELVRNFRLQETVLYAAASLFDRYMGLFDVPLNKLQLVILVCVMIAAKVEEEYSWDITKFVLNFDKNMWSKEETKWLERSVLEALDYRVNYPNPLDFVRRLSLATGKHTETRNVAKFLIMNFYTSSLSITVSPSLIASSAFFIARDIISGIKVWDQDLINLTGFTYNDLKPIVIDMMHVAIFDKELTNDEKEAIKYYANPQRTCASKVVENWVVKRFVIDAELERLTTDNVSSQIEILV